MLNKEKVIISKIRQDTKYSTLKIGLFGIGLNTYWDQFDGLLEKLKKYQKRVKK